MAKKKVTVRSKAPKLPTLQTWRVNLQGGTEEVLANSVENWDGTLTFTTHQLGPDGSTDPVVVRGFAPGQWLDYAVVPYPTAEPTSNAS